MISDRLNDLQDYPFWRMNALVKDIPLPDGHPQAIPRLKAHLPCVAPWWAG
jgi:hypothetical protein